MHSLKPHKTLSISTSAYAKGVTIQSNATFYTRITLLLKVFKYNVAVQTDENIVPYHNIDLDSALASSFCVDNSLKASKATECITVQTDVVPTSSPSKFGHRPPTFQECLMEAEILRMEQENQRLNALLAYTRAEMTLEMHRRIAELRRVWSYELMTVVESAGRIWEDVIQIVDAVKRCQWCAYCGRIAYYYCCWNTSYCNRKLFPVEQATNGIILLIYLITM
ncbi:unnamed protein product [Heterobilharzia americana]|nr:unnamed protein product [Heterobilharzia americana]